MAAPAPTVVIYAKTARQDRPMLWPDLLDLAAASLANPTQYNRIGRLLLRNWVWDPLTALRYTQDAYTVRWFAKDHAAQYSLTGGCGLRVWHQGSLTPWKDLQP